MHIHTYIHFFQDHVVTDNILTFELDGVENSTSYNVSIQFQSIAGIYGLPTLVQYTVPAMGLYLTSKTPLFSIIFIITICG